MDNSQLTHRIKAAFARRRLLSLISWNILGNAGGKIITPLLHILIASFLLPSDYGVFSICLLLVSFFTVIRDLGFTDSIIVDNTDEGLHCIQFLIELCTGVAYYLLICSVRNELASLFNYPALTHLLPVFMLSVLIAPYIDAMTTKCLKEQNFKLLALRHLLMPVGMGVVALPLAYLSFGVHALIYGYLSGLLLVFLMFVRQEGMITPRFDWTVIKNLFRLGKHIVWQRMFGFISNQIDTAIIAARINPANLGIYKMSNQVALILPQSIYPNVSQVLFTEYAACSDQHIKRQSTYNRFVLFTGATAAVYSIATYVLSPLFVPLFFTPEWQHIAPLIPIFAHCSVTGSVTLLNAEIAKIEGFAKYYSVYGAVRALLTIIVLFCTAAYGIVAVSIAFLFLSMIGNLVNDLIFYRSQSLILIDKPKIVVYLLAWLWSLVLVFSVS